MMRKLFAAMCILLSMPLLIQAAGLKSPWAGGNIGSWYVENGILKCWPLNNGDPNHVWVEQALPDGDYTVQADIRMMGWQDADGSRAGVAMRIETATRRGINFLLHNDLNSVDFLNDNTAWGTQSDFAWELGKWYTMTISGSGTTVTGTLVPKDGSEEPFEAEWTDDRNDDRDPGFPGLTGFNVTNRYAEFDNFKVISNGTVVFQDDFGANTEPVALTPLAAPWITGQFGDWGVRNGYLYCRALMVNDPKHVYVDQDFGSDYTVKADVRMLNWVNHDYSRSGVSVRVNPEDSERALNLLLHNDLESVDLLNDAVAWGTAGTYRWQPGKWYTLTLTATGNTLTGSIVPKGQTSGAYSIEWTDDRNGTRAPGLPGLAGNSGANVISQYDNFEVLIDNQVVFTDDFGANVAPDWIVTRDVPGDNYTLGQILNDISLAVDVADGKTVNSLVIEEVVPAGLIPSDIQTTAGAAAYADGKITWTLSAVSADQKLTYDLQAPQRPNITTISWGGSALGDGVDVPLNGLSYEQFQGDVTVPLLTFNISESFSYPSGAEDNSLEGEKIAGQNGGRGWGSNAWTAITATENVVLDLSTLDAGLVMSQPTQYNPGNYSAKLSGLVEGGLARKFPVTMAGVELWISYTYKEEGPAADHWSGITIFNSAGTEVAFVGKPYNAQYLGIGNLPGGDALTNVSYQQAHHVLVRIVINGNSSQVFMWVNPDKNDRMNTYDAMGNDQINNIQEIRLRRGGATGSAYYDNMWFSSVPALPPAGAGRFNLQIDDPNRPAELPAWDVISMDQFDDSLIGIPGFGHDPGEDHYLIVSGFIYFDASMNQTVAFGLPPDRMSGLNGHILGAFNYEFNEEGFKNAIKFENNDQQRGPFRFELDPPGKYSELRSAQTVASGDGQLFCTLHYEDGSTEETFLNADDWYDDPSDGNVRFSNTVLLVDGMNRLQGSANEFDARFDPAISECFISVNPDKVLTAVTLLYNEAVDVDAAYNLFDIWAVPPSAETRIGDWSLF